MKRLIISTLFAASTLASGFHMAKTYYGCHNLYNDPPQSVLTLNNIREELSSLSIEQIVRQPTKFQKAKELIQQEDDIISKSHDQNMSYYRELTRINNQFSLSLVSAALSGGLLAFSLMYKPKPRKEKEYEPSFTL